MNPDIKILDNPTISHVKGYAANGMVCGIKQSGKLDLGIAVSEVPAKTYAMYTTNKVQAAPLKICQEHLKDKEAQMLVVNSGIANACTGEEGLENAIAICRYSGDKFNISPGNVISMSTGVIGQQLPVDKIKKGIDELKTVIHDKNDNLFSKAIMTTDSFEKIAGIEMKIGDSPVTIVGVTKGAGMIHPGMATMLAFFFTDADIDYEIMQDVFHDCVQKSYNSITVDGDMSTNDTALIMANGQAGNSCINQRGSKELELFTEGLSYLTKVLAKKIVEDGEGASKIIEINVLDAASEEDAKTVAASVATSSLVKTAFFGEDANWGRIIAAVGYSGIDFNPDKVILKLENMVLFENGKGTGFSEEEAKRILQNREVTVNIHLNTGTEKWTYWSSDLTHDYVKINAGYRT